MPFHPIIVAVKTLRAAFKKVEFSVKIVAIPLDIFQMIAAGRICSLAKFLSANHHEAVIRYWLQPTNFLASP